MGYLYPLPKKFLCSFVRIPGVVWRQVGEFNPQTPRGFATDYFSNSRGQILKISIKAKPV
jgi:hypothetical protein